MEITMKIEPWQLKMRQGLPLWMKIEYTKKRIKAWYEHWDGQVYVSFSGGKDSTVLLDIVRQLYPEVPAVFVDTGLEYPEIRDFVKTFDNVVWLKPKMTFKSVIKKYGYPVVSKKTSMGISRYRNTKSDIQKSLRINGGINPTSGKKQQASVAKKWHFLLDAPFKISERCCQILKKDPIHRYNKESGRKAIVGTMACDSDIRRQSYLNTGCNAIDRTSGAMSTPMSFWLEHDVWDMGLEQCSIYDMGYDRTGCAFCMFGCHMEGSPSRFQRMKQTHPNLYNYCINKLGCGKVLDFIGVPYEPEQTLF